MISSSSSSPHCPPSALCLLSSFFSSFAMVLCPGEEALVPESHSPRFSCFGFSHPGPFEPPRSQGFTRQSQKGKEEAHLALSLPGRDQQALSRPGHGTLRGYPTVIARIPQNSPIPRPRPWKLVLLGLRGWDSLKGIKVIVIRRSRPASGTVWICGSSRWLPCPLYPAEAPPWV